MKTVSVRPLLLSSRAASISTRWPFHEVSRAARSTIRSSGCDLPFGAQLLDPRHMHGAGREKLEVGAARNDLDRAGRPGIMLGDQVAGIARVGDHQVAACHHGIVVEFHGALAAVAAVERRGERHVGQARGSERHPGRRPRARMDDAGALEADEPGELAHVQGHGQRVLGVGRKRDPDAAPGLEFADQPPARGRDQGPGAGVGQGARDVDGRAFGPAGVQRGNDLQHRAAGERAAASARRETRELAASGPTVFGHAVPAPFPSDRPTL